MYKNKFVSRRTSSDLSPGGSRLRYTGIDSFRMVAALLIVAIHTSPLLSFSETGDFVLTRVLARLAVPFFFTVSGFFLISRYSRDKGKLKGFIKKTALIYGIAIVIYIPINIYNDYFSMEFLLPNILKDIVFDGTMYHLWYLPASILGAAVAWYLVKRLDYARAFGVTGFLYLVGLFGDSYYGIAQEIPVLRNFYELVFQVSDYSRNGLFFAPVFFVLGGYMAEKQPAISARKAGCMFGGALLLMLGEALTLHHFELQRHDSMYLFLLPALFFGFQFLIHFQGEQGGWARDVSLVVYIIHPMMIVAVRLTAKLTGLTGILVENSLIHFLVVSLLSLLLGGGAVALWDRFYSPTRRRFLDKDRAWIEINRKHLEHNVRVLQGAMPAKCQLMAVVKDEAYGHGAYEVAVHLNKIGVEAFAVATIDEGIALRKFGIRGEILILGYTEVRLAKKLKKYDLTQTLVDFEYAKALNRQGIEVKTHIKIDTGMHRLGIPCNDAAAVKKVFSMRCLRVEGIYTHLCCSDSLKPEDVAFTRGQIGAFYRLLDELRQEGISVPKTHIQSSYGLLNYPDIVCDYARVGIALYGVLSSSDNHTVQKLDLKPVLSLKARVALIRKVPKGSFVGYGRDFCAERDSRIAILPIGYGDGFPRSLSGGRGSVLIHGQQAPVVGRVCMDQIAVDVTDIPEVFVGDTATLIGMETDGALRTPEVAELTGSISNELLSRMGVRLPVVACD